MPETKKKAGQRSRKRRRPPAAFIGEIFTLIAGGQYYDAQISPGGAVHLEREPDNKHDENAIRIENGRFQQVGYVPRNISSWLSPLIDSGEVWVEGRTVSEIEKSEEKKRIIFMDLYLHRKGRHILERDPDPKGELEGLHQAVLAVWREIEDWTHGDTVSALADRLKAVEAEDTLPKTRMLLSLFKHKAWNIRRMHAEREMGEVRDSLKKLKLGKAIFYRNLTVFPLVSGNGHKPAYILLADAIKKKQADVREVSEQGSVPELIVENRASMPILIPEGEILVGAKQNRTVNITILVAAKTEQVIPVSCVEQGRWSRSSETFASAHWSTPLLRCMKIATSQRSREQTGRAFSDQARVWADVAERLSVSGTVSSTGSITDVFKNAQKVLEEYRSKIVLPRGSVGILVAVEGEVLGMDLFDSPGTMSKVWPRLSRSYFLEAAFREKAKRSLKATAEEFIAELAPILRFAKKASGAGRELELSGTEYAGSGLWYKGRLRHLAAFRMKRDRA